MKRFKNILVGADLSRADRLVVRKMTRHTDRACRTALELAKANSARLLFFYSLDLSVDARKNLERNIWPDPSIKEMAQERLSELTSWAKENGVEAEDKLTFGRPWAEICQQVELEEHDLAIIGTRKLSSFRSLLLESTGLKLLRKCPCPVWITKNSPREQLRSILVAYEVSPLGALAMEVAGQIAQAHGAELHVLKMIGRDHWDTSGVLGDGDMYSFHAQQFPFTQVHYSHGAPFCKAVLDNINRHKIELVVLGTETCTGLSGFLKRSTAEKVVSGIPCSLLALKPPKPTDTAGVSDHIDSHLPWDSAQKQTRRPGL